MNCGDRSQWNHIDHFQHMMDPLQKLPHSLYGLRLLHQLRTLIQFTQVSTSRKSTFQVAVDDDRASGQFHTLQGLTERLEFFQCRGADLIAWCAVQNQLDNPIRNRIRHSFAGRTERLSGAHAVFTARYMSSISFFIRAQIKSRFNLPLAVSIPLSIEKGSSRT